MKIKPYPCLWFNNNAREAVKYYLSIFRDGKIIHEDYYTDVGEEITGHNKGDLLTIEFMILGQRYLALNAGPEFVFNPSISFVVECKDQKEIDYYWEKLSYNKEAEQCGWLQDKFGVSWQIVPRILLKMLKNGSELQRKNLTEAYFVMKKFDINKLEKAYNS
jgi:predicted 3-demethylubiquinone-9 3-methyltransferase (glyoxalase superfamily)